jgi:uncharacterized protein
MELVRRFFQLPDSSCFVFGPRGTGKSTWLAEILPSALVINLLRPELYRTLAAQPERLRHLVDGAATSDVIIDEVQRLPELLHGVHDLIEEHRGLRFVLTGSSARKLRRGGVDLLGGRALHRTLHPFMAGELPDFSLSSALELGLLPLVISSPSPRDTLAAYTTLYLEEEVKLEGWARDVGRFARFLEAISFSHAAVLNLSNVARECQAERKTVGGYLEVLEDLLLAFRLPVFTRRARRELSQHPKFYLFDAGVFRSLRPRGPLDRPDEIDGAALEGLVAQHLRAWIAYTGSDDQLYFWRTRSGVEVDFVVYGESGFFAIEVKNSGTVRTADLRGLRAFVQDYPECRPLFLYRGSDTLEIDGISCIPVEEFLTRLSPGVPIVGGEGTA